MNEVPMAVGLLLQAYDVLGADEAQPFLQGMLNRLGIGAHRYGRTNADLKTKPKDMVDTAILRAQVALREGNREGLIDAANFLFLAYRHMPEHESSESSPGVVVDGVITRARGVHYPTNGQRIDSGQTQVIVREPSLDECLVILQRRISDYTAVAEHRYDDIQTGPAVRPSSWADDRSSTGGPKHWDVV